MMMRRRIIMMMLVIIKIMVIMMIMVIVIMAKPWERKGRGSQDSRCHCPSHWWGRYEEDEEL